MKAAGESARGVFGAGISAASAGMSIQRTSAISQALLKGGNVPEEETQGWLAEMRQWQERLRLTGQGAERLTPLTQVGAGIAGMSDTPEQMMIKMARAFAGLTTDEAIARGALANLSPATSLELRRQGANLPASVAAAQATAVSNQDSEAARNLIDAQNKLAVSWGKLTRIIYDELDPAFTSMISTWTKAFDELINLAKTGDFVMGRGPEGQEGNTWAKRFLPGSIYNNLPRWLGGPGAANQSSPQSSAGSSTRSAFLDMAEKYESGGQNIPNAEGSGATGHWQILHGNWDRLAPKLGIAAKNPMEASKADQRRVAEALYDEQGEGAWTNYNPRLRAAWARRQASDGGAGSGSGGGLGGIPAPFPTLSQPNVPPPKWTNEQPDLSKLAPGRGDFGPGSPFGLRAPGSLAVLRAAQQASGDWSARPVPAGDVTHNTTIGDVTVNTRATDAAGTGAAVHSALKQLVTPANSGLA